MVEAWQKIATGNNITKRSQHKAISLARVRLKV
ncbi:hypothetical protein [Coxiella burnetii]|uniref:Uncharacterized protein n=3 Tax=Coxiella burnetii TaxID=777 RepID=Q83CM4_COXBU|nr:hypothetical protein [Coxiella burnetii]NP_820088.1 hypothetical protein CBU_1089 [Coxiella burnetii RSA 493]AAO90602.1 hypothetical protein CBU_1089 [Coxiella burnetii RSA 493]ABI95919.1 hypothetical protein [Coxiella burnetii]ABI95946.1 hypothetical protein [Coxiella burnetii]ABI95970.1 hypothetical protein [Coxiella burnetii]ABI95986.1 hypothetical protein [Coxiella burnetii]